MLLTITYTGKNTPDIGYLLFKNPSRPQMFELNHGKAYVFYPEVSDEKTTAALLLDIDPIDLARGKVESGAGGLFDYVNDRPYVSSSFMSTAISKVFGTAMTGRADAYQALSDSALDLTAKITMLSCYGEREKLNEIFEPLGYEVSYENFMADENFPAWGESKYVNLTLRGNLRLRDLLRHIHVLIPVFDRQKHYWVGADEVEKLLRIGAGWLENHPMKEFITRRYLKYSKNLVNSAFAKLATEISDSSEDSAAETAEISAALEQVEAKPDTKPKLNTQRLGGVIAALKNCGAKSVIDLGCGEGKLLQLLMKDSQFTKIAGMDVSHISLSHAAERLWLKNANERVQERINLFQGSLMYKDSRIANFDAACVIEVIEHLDPPRLIAFERVLFEFAKPRTVIITTPNAEYNVNYNNLHEENLRHADHRFEWTREQFREWACAVAEKFGYTVQFSQIGKADEIHGAPTQMGVFTI